MKKTILFLQFNLFIFNLLYGQFSPTKVSVGIEYANITSLDKDLTNGNSWKYGPVLNISKKYYFKRFFYLEGGLSYRERKQLEVFVFSFRDPNQQQIPGLGYRFIFYDYPSSKQNKRFDPKVNKEMTNFKYLHVQIVPSVSFGKQVRFTVGVGLIGGILLNPRATTVTKEDLPEHAAFFDPPFNAYGEVTYKRYDAALMQKISVDFPIFDQNRLGIYFSSFQSGYPLNNEFESSNGFVLFGRLDKRWLTFEAGIQFEFAKRQTKHKDSKASL